MELHRILAAARRQRQAETHQQEMDESDYDYEMRIDASINKLTNVELLDLIERAFS